MAGVSFGCNNFLVEIIIAKEANMRFLYLVGCTLVVYWITYMLVEHFILKPIKSPYFSENGTFNRINFIGVILRSCLLAFGTFMQF